MYGGDGIGSNHTLFGVNDDGLPVEFYKPSFLYSSIVFASETLKPSVCSTCSSSLEMSAMIVPKVNMCRNEV